MSFANQKFKEVTLTGNGGVQRIPSNGPPASLPSTDNKLRQIFLRMTERIISPRPLSMLSSFVKRHLQHQTIENISLEKWRSIPDMA